MTSPTPLALAPKPKPNPDIVLLLRGLLTQAEAGELQEIAAVWGTRTEFLSAAFGADSLTLGAYTYALAHSLMTENDE